MPLSLKLAPNAVSERGGLPPEQHLVEQGVGLDAHQVELAIDGPPANHPARRAAPPVIKVLES
ncbi:MAG: hypothetical protein WC729_20320 [Sphingomonas sp.]|uniref:hypothetical protein n=1 Tax=Sphingomonas sp. TaxID=28214 RepID=UPI003568BCA0